MSRRTLYRLLTVIGTVMPYAFFLSLFRAPDPGAFDVIVPITLLLDGHHLSWLTPSPPSPPWST